MDPRNIEETVERLQALAPTEAQPELVPADWMDEEDSEVKGPWTIQDRGSLEWALQRLATLHAELSTIDEQEEASVQRIHARARLLRERSERGRRFFEYRIAEYAQREKAALLGGGKKKSADLLHGRIGWRAKGGKLAVEDKAALVAWLERQPPESGLYRVKVEPEMKAIQDNFKATGEVPPGTTYVQLEDVFFCEPQAPELEGK